LLGKVVGDIADEDYLTAFEAWDSYLKTVLKLLFDAEVSEYQERGPLKCGDKVIVGAQYAKKDVAPENLAVAKRISLNIVRNEKGLYPKLSAKSKRLMASTDIE
jgi:hypothetical protein